MMNKENENPNVSYRRGTKRPAVHNGDRMVQKRKVSCKSSDTGIVEKAGRVEFSKQEIIPVVSESDDSFLTPPRPVKSQLQNHSNQLFKKHEELCPAQPLTETQLPSSLWWIEYPHQSEVVMTNTSFNLDVRYRNDPNFLSGSMGDLFCYLKTLQKQALHVDPRYLENQRHISENIRALSINAMFSVCRLLQLRRSSLFLSVRILDAYFSLRAPHSLQRTDMAVVGFASLMIAVKFEEGGTWSGERFFRKFFERVNSPNPNEMRDQIVQREDTILRYLRFRVNCPTAHSFLKRYELSGQLSQSAKEIARCICERSLFSYGMVKYLPSVVAAAAVSMARVADGLAPWTSALQSDTGYRPNDLQMCIDDLCDSFLEETVSRAREYTALLFEDVRARSSGKDNKVVTMKRLLEVLLSRSENDRNSDGSRVTAHHLLYETYLPQILQTGVDVERAKRQQQHSSDFARKESQPLQPVDGVMHRFPHRVYSRLVTCPPY